MSDLLSRAELAAYFRTEHWAEEVAQIIENFPPAEAEPLRKLAAACKVKAELYAQAHPEIPASFQIVAVEIERILDGLPHI